MVSCILIILIELLYLTAMYVYRISVSAFALSSNPRTARQASSSATGQASLPASVCDGPTAFVAYLSPVIPE